MRRIAVVGSRTFTDTALIHITLKRIKAKEPFVLVTGGADGVDTIAEKWARGEGIETKIYPADWEQFGDAAGPKRNAQIVNDSEMLVAFWDGESPGTLDVIKRGKSKKGYGVAVYLG